MSGAICGGVAVIERRVIECPTEGRRRRFVAWTNSLWYGLTWECLGCGDRWSSDGERGDRPFMRGWRKQAINHAKRLWADAPLTPSLKEFVRQEMAAVSR